MKVRIKYLHKLLKHRQQIDLISLKGTEFTKDQWLNKISKILKVELQSEELLIYADIWEKACSEQTEYMKHIGKLN